MLHTALPLILALAAPNMKFDANESAVFAQELEYVDKQATDQEFPQNRADEFIPVDTSIDAGAEDFSWYHFDRLGNAKLISSYADDLPRVHEFGSKNTTGIRSIGDSYGYSIQDLRAAAYMKRPLDPALALLAREAIERKADEIAALGSTTDNLPGFLKATGVPVMSSGFNGDWANATGQEILADLRLIYFTAKNQSLGIHEPDTMIFGSDSFAALHKPYSDLQGDTVAAVFLRSFPTVKSIDTWIYCDNADAQNDGERAVVYQKNPLNMKQIRPVGFESLAPQARNLQVVVPCHARTGGTVVKRPFSMLYVDGLMD